MYLTLFEAAVAYNGCDGAANVTAPFVNSKNATIKVFKTFLK